MDVNVTDGLGFVMVPLLGCGRHQMKTSDSRLNSKTNRNSRKRSPTFNRRPVLLNMNSPSQFSKDPTELITIQQDQSNSLNLLRLVTDNLNATDSLSQSMDLQKVQYKNDFFSISSSSSISITQYYQTLASHFKTQLPYVRLILSNSKDSFTSSRERNENVEYKWRELSDHSKVLDVYYRLEWVPPSLEWIMGLGMRLKWVQISRMNILMNIDQTVTFSWNKLREFFVSFLIYGKLNMPMAAVEGVLRIKLKKVDEKQNLVEIQDSVYLVSDFKSNRVRNRRIVSDFVLYCDTIKPVHFNTIEWNEMVFEKIPQIKESIRESQNTLNIDGLQNEQQTEWIQNVSFILFVFTGFILAFGVSVWIIYFPRIQAQLELLRSIEPQ
mmetsp:Transcript_11648/g.21088  ORF Transcript_11648/g.21088 Transcript_11648/m.21088 type:complete len:382 (+) Transcript_11648:1423-2568(+)